MSIFPVPATTFTYQPRVISIGGISVNNVTNNSQVSGGDASFGDALNYTKNNMGFGMVLGNFNVVSCGVNFVNDQDAFDQNGSLVQDKSTSRGITT